MRDDLPYLTSDHDFEQNSICFKEGSSFCTITLIVAGKTKVVTFRNFHIFIIQPMQKMKKSDQFAYPPVSLCLSVCPSTCLPVCLPVCLSVCLSVHLPVCLPACLSVCPPVYPPILSLVSHLLKEYFGSQ